jgi:hypothetical protein
MEPTIVESCHSTWIFDSDHKRFRRILKDIEFAHRSVTTEWRPYYEFQIDPQTNTFTIFLNAAGTLLIRSWLHTEDCVQCGSHVTTQLSLAEVRDAVNF